MATKEDVLEQLVEEYLIHRGYFVRHNVKYLPRKDHPKFISNQDSNHSDIDVLGYNPLKSGHEKVIAVSCKSWQSGFNVASELSAIKGNKIIRGRDAWRCFRELVVPKWSEAFLDAIELNTGCKEFTYIIAVTKINGDRSIWENEESFLDALKGNPIQFLSFKEIMQEVSSTVCTTLAATEIGRVIQIIKASGMVFK